MGIIYFKSKTLTREEIKQQLIENVERGVVYDDELAFELHLIRKWSGLE